MSIKNKTYVILGATSWDYFLNRGNYFAIELANMGHKVFFIEKMPSVAGKIKNFFSNKILNNKNDIPTNLKILTPPTCLTFFNSSYLPFIDKIQLHFWFNKIIQKYKLNNCILIYAMPYWRYLSITKELFSAKYSVYDIADDLQMFSRNNFTLNRMKLSDKYLKQEIDIIIYSSRVMKNLFSLKTPNSFLISNGVSDIFFKKNNSYKKLISDNIKVGFAGNFNSNSIDIDLLKHISDNSNFNLEVCGNINNSLKKELPKINFRGILTFNELKIFIKSCDVCIIPFYNNNFNSVINPLKLYEYSSLGKPIVATNTTDLKYYKDIIYFAKDKEEFVSKIFKAVKLDSNLLRKKRIRFAQNNLWSTKTKELDDIIDNFSNR
ncbi:MAG: glycosyltransferase [Bacteroidetes bacterium]|nr:glycosyltransferase [Bacteroidota bacterium]